MSHPINAPDARMYLNISPVLWWDRQIPCSVLDGAVSGRGKMDLKTCPRAMALCLLAYMLSFIISSDNVPEVCLRGTVHRYCIARYSTVTAA